ncbi:MAG: class I SAM-dependent methyltransferase [Rhodothermales bacterium]|nr:class I SAM-dependent methyltransferase [Rhodothermales bacterium]
MPEPRSIASRLLDTFGQIDIYLFDQLMRGRFDTRHSILDAGCGRGRNLVYFMNEGFDVFGVDQEEAAIASIRRLAGRLGVSDPDQRFQTADLAGLPYSDARFDAVICSAVLHFARDESHFEGMIREMTRVLRPGGLFFARLASTIGVEHAVTPLHGRWHRLPDGSDRFLVDEALLVDATRQLGGTLLDPLKTTVVQGMRAMTTWVFQRDA